jgi:hypothetical protein
MLYHVDLDIVADVLEYLTTSVFIVQEVQGSKLCGEKGIVQGGFRGLLSQREAGAVLWVGA